MTTATIFLHIFTGLLAGILSSLIGFGGRLIVVPAMASTTGMQETKAQRTTLAMLLPPIGLLGVWQYYRQEQVDLKIADILCARLIMGGFVVAKIVLGMDKAVLKKSSPAF